MRIQGKKAYLSKSEHSALVEALRRRLTFNNRDQSITEQWTGLGCASEYRAAAIMGFMAIDGQYAPRAMRWWRLTPKGARIIAYWMGQGFTVDESNWSIPGVEIPTAIL